MGGDGDVPIGAIGDAMPAVRPPLIRLTSSQASLKVSLAAMGFGEDVIERAILTTRAKTIEQAIEAIIRMDNGEKAPEPFDDGQAISEQRRQHAEVLGVLNAGSGAAAGADGAGGGVAIAPKPNLSADVMPELQKQLSIKAQLLRENLWECTTYVTGRALSLS